MSFKANAAEKAALANQQKIGDTAVANSEAATGAGKGFLGAGQGYLNQAGNFLTTLLNGNRANTSALLQPNIDQARQAQAQALQGASTLMPRGAGRSASLFDSLMAPAKAVTSLFGAARTGAVDPLMSLGGTNAGVGTGLLGQGNQALGTAGNISGNILNYEQQNRQMKNQFWGSLGGGLFNLATMPLGGATGLGGSSTALGKLGGIFR